ncbi:hypothetical protein [Pseudomonas sp. REB1044]|uniref:hypothetical protein n=1 Tax=Pseudomonas sp. REB1044 TaxID=2675224 RepID=UPI00315C68EB
MSSIHDQAMHYIYQQVLERLLDHMTQAQRASVQLLVQRLLVSAGGVEYLRDFRLLVLLGYDRSNVSLLAFLRAAQLSIALRGPETFRLQVVVNARPALTDTLLDHLERTFGALFLHDDPRVELLLVGAGYVQPFSRDPSCTAESQQADRDALLMFGHLCAGQPEAVLGSRLHLELGDTVRTVLQRVAQPSAVITAVPLRQRQRFVAWSRAAMRVSGERGDAALHRCAGALCELLGRMHCTLASPLQRPDPVPYGRNGKLALRIIAVDDLLNERRDDDRLVEALGLGAASSASPTPLGAFSDPAYLAHLQRLRTHWLGSANDTAWLASEPGHAMLQRAFGIDDVQSTCLLFAPFAERGEGLAAFVQRCHPAMRVALPYLHRALQGEPCPDAVVQWLLDTSGLSLAQLRGIYNGRIEPTAARLMHRLARRDARLRLVLPPMLHVGVTAPIAC